MAGGRRVGRLLRRTCREWRALVSGEKWLGDGLWRPQDSCRLDGGGGGGVFREREE